MNRLAAIPARLGPLVLALGSLGAGARADDDPPPPLLPPAGSATEAAAPIAPAPLPRPAESRPSPITPTPARRPAPVLALPGLTAPAAAPVRPPTSLPPPSLAPSADGGLPLLEMPAPASTRGPISIPLPSSRFRPALIESTPSDDLPPVLDAPPLLPASRPTGSARRQATGLPPIDAPRTDLDPLELDEIDRREVRDLTRRPGTPPSDTSKDDGPKGGEPHPKVSSPRRPGLFGGRLNLLAPPRGGLGPGIDSGLRDDEPKADPAADAATKRRIEKQAHEAVGDRARTIEVRVVGRAITIQARGVKFLQRRSVRRALETLPGLSGHKTRVEVLD